MTGRNLYLIGTGTGPRTVSLASIKDPETYERFREGARLLHGWPLACKNSAHGETDSR